MANRIREYHRPESLDTVKELFNKQGVKTRILAVHPQLKSPLFRDADVLVDLSSLNLDYIRVEGGNLHIGILTPLQRLVESPLVRSLANGILSEAAQLSAGLGLRNLWTLFGNLAINEQPLEFGAVHACLDVREVHQDGLPLEWQIPLRANVYGALCRVGRTQCSAAIVTACAVVETQGGKCIGYRMKVCSRPLADSDFNVSHYGYAIQGKSIPTDSEIEERVGIRNMGDDYQGGAEYRREMAKVLAKRATGLACKRAGVK